MGERLHEVRGVTLCAETFGRSEDPAVLLLGGAMCSMDYWDPEFCALIAEAGRFVIRFDYRDTGRSQTYRRDEPGYRDTDFVLDALGLLDVLGVDRAHVVGISMGGGLAQSIVAGWPERVASLTLISTSPSLARASDAPALPPIGQGYDPSAEQRPDPDWSDRTQLRAWLLGTLKDERGSRGIDDASAEALAARIAERSELPFAATNHWVILGGESSGEPLPTELTRLSEITVPTLVIHGDEDPLFGNAHGEALAAEVPGAEFMLLAGVAHEYPPRATWSEVVPAMVRTTS